MADSAHQRLVTSFTDALKPRFDGLEVRLSELAVENANICTLLGVVIACQLVKYVLDEW